MFDHLVSFKFKGPLELEQQNRLLDALYALKTKIPGIVELTAGINVTEEIDNIHGYTLGLRVTFKNREALLEYGPHPAHRQFVDMLDGIVESVVVVDYPIRDTN